MFFNCLLVCHLILNSVYTIEIHANNDLLNTATKHRVKRYHYQQPQNWAYPSTTYKSYDPYRNPYQPIAYTIDYYYHKFDDVPFKYKEEPQTHEDIISDPKYVAPPAQIQPNTYSNEQPIYSTERNTNDQTMWTSQPFQPFEPYVKFDTTELISSTNADDVETLPSLNIADTIKMIFNNSNNFDKDTNISNISITRLGEITTEPEVGEFEDMKDLYRDEIIPGVLYPCDVYDVPVMPDFRAPGRRISAVKCYEYFWEQKVQNNGNRTCSTKKSTISPKLDIPDESRQPDEFQEGSPTQGNMTQPTNSDTYIYSQPGFGFAFMKSGPEEFPHMAALGWRGVYVEYVFKCGGSIISRNFVLTAAHCTASAPDPAIKDLIPRIVRVGDINIGFRTDGRPFEKRRRRRQIETENSKRLDVGISKIIRHEQYNPNRRYFDIALLQLEYQLEFNNHLRPACLSADPNTVKRKRKAIAAGWGIVNLLTRETALDLQAGELDIIDTPTCNQLLLPSFGSRFSQVVDHQLCAGILSGGSDVCQGDSGGPLQVKIDLDILTFDRIYLLLGIISAGVGCGRPDTPGVYTRISSFVDWIEGHVWQ